MPRRRAPLSSCGTSSGFSTLPLSKSFPSGIGPGPRPRTSAYSIGGVNDQRIVCAVSESRGVSPTVGLAFVNLSTGEAVLSQLCDSQSYVRTIHKLKVFDPSQLLVANTAVSSSSKMLAVIEENIDDTQIIGLDHKYWSETSGLDYIQRLAFAEDVEAIRASIGGNFFATCCVAAALKYVELALSYSFASHSLRITYQPPEGAMMIDLSTIRSLELIQNLRDPKSKHCLFGFMNETLTPMGARFLRSNILQPLTDPDVLKGRFDALEELSTKEEMFFAARRALKPFQDVDKLLTALITIPAHPTVQHVEHSINDIVLLKHFINSVPCVFEALADGRCHLLGSIRDACAPERVAAVQQLIDETINEEVTYQTKPVELMTQRVSAVKSGVNGLLDVSRQTFNAVSADIFGLGETLKDEHTHSLQLKFENARQYFFRLPASEVDETPLPPLFTNIIRKKKFVECQTLDLMKLNQRLRDCHTHIIVQSNKSIQTLTEDLRQHMSVLFKIADALAMLDMLAAFGQIATTRKYARPEVTDTLAIKAARHPIMEKIQRSRFIPNDVYASRQSRLQIITGCNMSGKSTYIRSIALLAVMAQTGSFVPAQYASFPIIRQLFARISLDDSIEANVSTFAAEMRETAFILRNIDRGSMIIIDELGRGTSIRDGLAIALGVAEALAESNALVWFATHFRELAEILAERDGVINLHLAVEMTDPTAMTMLYKISEGFVKEEHYGLALAGVVDLPPMVLEVARQVSYALSLQAAKNKRTSKSVALAKRRRLILSLHETLVQAQNGSMRGHVLTAWLKKLQEEFVIRMTAIEAEMSRNEMPREAGSGSYIADEVVCSSPIDDVDTDIQAGRFPSNEITASIESEGAVPLQSVAATSLGDERSGQHSRPRAMASLSGDLVVSARQPQPGTRKLDENDVIIHDPAYDGGEWDLAASQGSQVRVLHGGDSRFASAPSHEQFAGLAMAVPGMEEIRFTRGRSSGRIAPRVLGVQLGHGSARGVGVDKYPTELDGDAISILGETDVMDIDGSLRYLGDDGPKSSTEAAFSERKTL